MVPDSHLEDERLAPAIKGNVHGVGAHVVGKQE
jgi:hypothetical protein